MTVAEVFSTDGKVLRVNAPDWFKREDFMAWLNSPTAATWHIKGCAKANDMSDAFFTHCDDDGSDSPMSGQSGIPEDIWEEICGLVAEAYDQGAECLVWVSNLEQ